jgi:hypothetical protein
MDHHVTSEVGSPQKAFTTNLARVGPYTSVDLHMLTPVTLGGIYLPALFTPVSISVILN